MPSLLYSPQETRVNPATTPANATGANFTTAVGQAMSELGHQGSRVVSDFNRIQEHQQEADGAAWLAKTVSDGYIQWKQYSEEAKTKAAPNGSGYTPQLLTDYDKWSDSTLPQAPTPRTQKMLAEQLGHLRTNLAGEAITWEAGQRRSYRMDQVDQSITQSAALIQKDPKLYETLQQSQLDSINSISGELHPEDRRRLDQQSRKMFAEAAALGQVQQNPELAVATLSGKKPLPMGSVQSKIIAQAKESGVDPQTALAIASIESNYNPTAKNPASSASGVFQLIDSSWDMYGGNAPRDNVDAQVKAGIGYIADTQKAMKQTFGRDPTPGELYMGHLFGQAGAQAIIKSPDAMPIEKAVARYAPNNVNTIVNANGMTGMTVGQVKALWSGVVSKHWDKATAFANAPLDGEVPSGNPAFDALTPQGREAMLTHAEQLSRKNDINGRVELEAKVKDAVAAYQRGEAPQNTPPMDEFVKAYGTQGIAKYREMVGWQQFGADVAKVKVASPDEQLALYNSMQPSGEGYADNAQRQEALGKAISYVNQQRQDDPISFDQTQGAKITNPLDVNDPNFFTSSVAGRYIQADQISQNFGTPYSVFSKTEAAALGKFIDQASPDQALGYLRSLRGAADSTGHYRAALSQIAPNHPVLAVAGHIADRQPPGQPDAAQLIIIGDRILNPSKTDKAQEGSAKIPLPSDGGFAGFRDSWEKAVGQAYGTNNKSYEQDFQAAKAYYVGAQDPGSRREQLDLKLWKKAINAVAPTAIYGGAKTLIPYGSNPTEFSDKFTAAWAPTLAKHGLDANEYPPQAFQPVAIDDGVYGVRSGTSTLFGKNGEPVIIDLNNQPQAQGMQSPFVNTKLTRNVFDRRFR